MQRALVYLLLLATPMLVFAESGQALPSEAAVALESASDESEPESTGSALLQPLLEGEFALQGGDPATAARAFAQAMLLSDDPKIAERAVQTALLANELELARQALSRWQALQPDDANIAAASLRLALRSGDNEAARDTIAKLFAREDGWKMAAAALSSHPDKNAASALLGELIEADQLPDVFDAWLTLGGVALRLNDKDLYAKLAANAPEKFPEQPRAWVWLAESARERGAQEASRQALRKALSLPGLDDAALLGIAAQFNAIGDPATAARTLERASGDDAILGARATYLLRAKDNAGLDALYRDASRNPDDKDGKKGDPKKAEAKKREFPPQRLFLIGQISEMREDHAAALEWYRKITSGPTWEQAQLRIALVLDKLGRHDEAIARLREIQAGDVESGELIRDAYLFEAELHRQANAGKEELAALARGLSIFEDDPGLLYSRALAYERADRVDEAIADLRALSEDAPEDPTYLNALGYTLADRTDKLQEALGYIEKAYELDPHEPAILDSMGWVLHKLGKHAEALPFLQKAFEQQRDAEIAAHLANVLWALGQKDEARSMLRLGLELGGDSRALQAAIEMIGE